MSSHACGSMKSTRPGAIRTTGPYLVCMSAVTLTTVPLIEAQTYGTAKAAYIFGPGILRRG